AECYLFFTADPAPGRQGPVREGTPPASRAPDTGSGLGLPSCTPRAPDDQFRDRRLPVGLGREPAAEPRLQAEQEFRPVEAVPAEPEQRAGGPHWVLREEPAGDLGAAEDPPQFRPDTDRGRGPRLREQAAERLVGQHRPALEPPPPLGLTAAEDEGQGRR